MKKKKDKLKSKINYVKDVDIDKIFDGAKINNRFIDEYGQMAVELPKDFIPFDKKIAMLKEDGSIVPLKFAKPKKKNKNP